MVLPARAPRHHGRLSLSQGPQHLLLVLYQLRVSVATKFVSQNGYFNLAKKIKKEIFLYFYIANFFSICETLDEPKELSLVLLKRIMPEKEGAK